MISWLLSILSPLERPKSFHPLHDMPGILGYQERCERARGEDYSMERQYTVGVRITKVAEGEYIYPYPKSSLHYTEAERPGLAFFPISFEADRA
jgi:hypothetical protein